MKEVRLKSMKLENYKGRGTWNFSADFGKATRVSGANRCGKTSVMDAYMEVLTGKLSDGSMPDGVRPHDKDGKDLNRADVVRELILEVDGKETTVRKVTSQKWRRPRGQAEEVFDGNKTAYSIDGFESGNQKDYQNFVEGIAPADTLLMCSNARPFLNLVQKSTAEARKLLETLAGFSVEGFIAENPEYQHIGEITKGHPVEDALKKLRKDLKAQKDATKKARANLEYEQARDVSGAGAGLPELEFSLGEVKARLAKLDGQEAGLDEAVRAYDAAAQEILRLKFDQGEIVRKANEGIVKAKSEADAAVFGLREELKKAQREMCTAERDLGMAEKKIGQSSEDLRKAKEDYPAIRAEEFDGSRLEAVKAEEIDEGSFTCPTCGQALPEEMRRTALADFEEKKRERVEKEEKRRSDWEEDRRRRLEDVTANGNRAQADRKQALADKADAEKRMADAKEQIASIEKMIADKEAEAEALPDEADLSGNAEYTAVTAMIAKKEAALGEMSNGGEKRAEIKAERDRLMSERAEYEAKILKAKADAEEKDKRIDELAGQVREQGQKEADIEKDIDDLTGFSIKKNQDLAQKINPHFKHFKFRFLEFTQDESPVETVKMMCGGTSYSGGLNLSDRILCEIDLVCGLQALNGLNLPIWVDNCESVDPDRLDKFIKDLPQQMVLLQRSDNEKLEVKTLK